MTNDNFKKTKLKNGVTVGYIPSDKTKSENLLIVLSLPIDENVTKYALLARVLNRGVKDFPTLLDLSRRRRELYNATVEASSFRYGETLMLSIAVSTMKQKYAYDDVDIFGGALDIARQMIFEPYMPNGDFFSEYIDSEKRMLADAIKAGIISKVRYSRTRLIEIMCEGEPYAIPSNGRLEHIEQITSKDLKSTLEYIRANGNVTMLYAGDRDEKEVVSMLEKLPFAERNAEFTPASPKKQKDGVNTVTETMDITQALLVMGFKTNKTLQNSDFIKLALFNEIFGGSPTSKLFMNVREKMSLCYFCQSSVDGHKDVMVVQSGIDSKNFEKTRDAVLHELDQIKNGNISPEEFESARLSLANSYKKMSDSPSMLCMWYLSRMMENRFDSPDDAAKALEALTVNDISEVAELVIPQTVYLLKGENK